MKHELYVQDPAARTTSYLLEMLADAADSATEAVGVFAFASRDGVEMLLGDAGFAGLLKRGSVTLIVGIDAVTNRSTLEDLAARSSRCRSLKVRVFWHDTGALFHPKVCYFRGAKRHTLIVGSGNLTPGGLRDHFEAFTVTSGSASEVGPLIEQLKRFLDSHKSGTRPIDDEALERAANNKRFEGIERATPKGRGASRGDHGELVSAPSGTRVLVAELPRGGDRWQQANFDGATIETFFKADAGSPTRRLVFLNEVNDDGTLGPDEVRPCVLTLSRNLRIQLRAHSRDDYPSRGRPIAVFRELKARHLAYQLLLPGEVGYKHALQLLADEPPETIRRRTTTVRELASGWRSCPLLRLRHSDESES